MKQFIELLGLAEGDFIGNYAPNPEAQDIYKGLAQQKLSDVTASQITNLTDPVFIQAENQDRLITMNIINEAAMRNGQVMPNTGGILAYTQTVANEAVNIIPPDGEVWKIMGICIQNSATPTGSNNYYTFLSDPTQTAIDVTPSANREVLYSVFSSSSLTLGTETIFEEVFQPLLITSQMYLRLYSSMSNVAGGASVAWRIGYMRIR